IAAPWLAPIRNAIALGALLGFILFLPALGVALVKPAVVGTTGRASKENVRSIGYSIYYTLVNVGGAAGPLVAAWVHQHMSVENVFRDRKSTRLNSSHRTISYAVFCLKKKIIYTVVCVLKK